jgi:CATRA-Associated Small Protein
VSDIDEEARAEALDILTEIPGWRMPEPRWDHVAGLVDTIGTALATGDADMLRTATIDLELASPFRVTRMNPAERQPPPQKVQDRVNHLIHSLGGDSKGPEKPART